MDEQSNQPTTPDALRVFEIGIRIALEEMLVGRDYARVEDILRALADSSSVPLTSKGPPAGDRG